MHRLLGLRTRPKPRVPFIIAALPFVAHPLKLNPKSDALVKHENEIVRISFSFSHFSLKRAVSSSKLLMYLKYVNRIQDKKIVLEGRKNVCNGNSKKNELFNIYISYHISTSFLGQPAAVETLEQRVGDF